MFECLTWGLVFKCAKNFNYLGLIISSRRMHNFMKSKMNKPSSGLVWRMLYFGWHFEQQCFRGNFMLLTANLWLSKNYEICGTASIDCCKFNCSKCLLKIYCHLNYVANFLLLKFWWFQMPVTILAQLLYKTGLVLDSEDFNVF